MDYATLRQAIDREVHAENLTDEQEQVFRAFAFHNQISFDEVPQVFSEWHVKQTDELFKKSWFKEMLPESDTAYGTILDISQLVDEYKVEAPRQFAEGGSVRPKLRPEGFPELPSSPKPRLRPDPERQYGLADVEFRADMDSILSKDPIARLGFDPSRARYDVAEGVENAAYLPSNAKEPVTLNNGTVVYPDTVVYGPDMGSSKSVIAHEFRHRGFDLLHEMFEQDPDGFIKKYGKEAVELLYSNPEFQTELFDVVDERINLPGDRGTVTSDKYLDYVDKKDIEHFKEKGYFNEVEPKVQIGILSKDALNKGIVGLRFAAEDALKKAGEPTGFVDMSTGSKTRSSRRYKPNVWQRIKKKFFAEGGAVGNMNRQMELFARGGLKDDGMDMDPVSGNEVPSGSLAKEVRDDIPAQLSEGEYVVPADVVRYYGVKFFEDLREQAKIGLTEMEADGRIGGEPVMDQGVTEEDLAALDQMLTTGAYNGGLMDKLEYAAKNDPMVNQRLNQGGMVVGFAEGGMTQSLYSDPTQIDMVINKVVAAARQNPEIMEQLSARGIQINRTEPQMAPQQMDQANPPQEARQAMAVGGNVVPMPTVPGYDASEEQMYNYITSPTTINPVYTVPGASYSHAEDGALPTPKPQEPVASPEYCDSIGMMFDPTTNACVPKPQVQTSTDDDGSEPMPTGDGKPAFEDWGKELNFMDPDSIREWGKGLSEPIQGGKFIQGAGILAGGPAALLAGGITAGDALKDISDLRAAAIIADARGDTTLAEDLNEMAEKRIKSSSGIVDMLDELVATGRKKADAYVKQFGNFESAEDYKQKKGFSRERQYTVKDLKQDQAERERVQAMSRQQAEDAGIDTGGRSDDNDRDPFEDFRSAATGTATITDSTGEERTVVTYDPDKVREEAATTRVGGRAKGGLIKRRK
jgi:hypothetical protein